MHTVANRPPTTPSRSSFSSPTQHTYPPLHSSPLASSPASSPSAAAHSRRRAQYKSNPFSTPSKERPQSFYTNSAHRNAFVQGNSAGVGPSRTSSAATEEPPRQVFLRERLKTRCLERAVEKRERAKARGKRHLSSEPSSDGMDEMMEEDDEDEDNMLNDEFYRRIVDSTLRKERHAYRLSYAQDVGSSFDPDMEDPQSWEEELQRVAAVPTDPHDLDEEEIAAYAAEAELNLDDLVPEDIFSLSDYEDALDADVKME